MGDNNNNLFDFVKMNFEYTNKKFDKMGTKIFMLFGITIVLAVLTCVLVYYNFMYDHNGLTINQSISSSADNSNKNEIDDNSKVNVNNSSKQNNRQNVNQTGNLKHTDKKGLINLK